jgi:hypothetical protein
VKKLLLLLLIMQIFCLLAPSQTLEISKLGEAKAKLENLQKELWKIDREQYQDIAYLRRQNLIKGEFETTKQFEERQKKQEDSISALEVEALKKTGPGRQAVQRQINEILKTEFTGRIKLLLSKYDADNQQFTIFSSDNIPFNYLKVLLTEAKSLKDNFSECKTTGSAALLLNEKNVAHEYILQAKLDCNGKTYQATQQPFTAVKAMQMVFGNFNTATKTSLWENYELEPEDNENSANAIVTSVLKPVTSEVTLFKSFRENGIEKFLLVTNRKGTTEDEEMEWTCHACYGIPSVATFVKTPNYWKIETVQKHAGEIGSYGTPGEPSLIKIGPEKYALKFSWGDMGMGYERGGEYYWIVSNGIINEILNVYTSEDNTAAEGPKKDLAISNSKVIFTPGNNPEFFDVKIVKTGKKSVKVGRTYVLKPFSEIELYVYLDGKYQPVKK